MKNRSHVLLCSCLTILVPARAELVPAPAPPASSEKEQAAVSKLPEDLHHPAIKFAPRLAESLPAEAPEEARIGEAAPVSQAKEKAAPKLARDTWRTSGNHIEEDQVAFLGTLSPVTLWLGAAGRPVIRIEPALSPNIVSGHEANHTGENTVGAVIAGGGRGDLFPNRAEGDFSTVSGGSNNRAGLIRKYGNSEGATVGGGNHNQALNSHSTVSGGSGNRSGGLGAVVSGGRGNRAEGPGSALGGGVGNRADGEHAVIAGGHTNAAPGKASAILGGESNRSGGYGSAVAGGIHNEARGMHSLVAGGSLNLAAARHSLAGGHRAKALHPGSFVWADGQGSDFASTGDGQFLVRASGNVGIDTADPREKLTVAGNVAPSEDGTYTLGSPERRWRRLYLGEAVDYAGSLHFRSLSGEGMVLDTEGNLRIRGKVIAAGFEDPRGGVAVGTPPTAAAAGSFTAAEAAQVAERAVKRYALARPEATARRGQLLGIGPDGQPAWQDAPSSASRPAAALPGAPQIELRAPEGIRLRTHAEADVGASMAPGSHAMSIDGRSSIRRNLIEVGNDLVLERLSRLSIPVWNLSTQDDAVFHIGPNAAEFKQLFGVGESEDHLNSGDADGVALSAIQGLYQLVKEQQAVMNRKDGEITALRNLVAELEKRVLQIESSRPTPLQPRTR